MGYFQVRYDSRVVIYERKMFIRLATGVECEDSKNPWAVLVVKWSVFSPSTPTIRVRIPLKSTVFCYLSCLKITKVKKEAGDGPL